MCCVVIFSLPGSVHISISVPSIVGLITSTSDNGTLHLCLNLGMSIDPGEAGWPLHEREMWIYYYNYCRWKFVFVKLIISIFENGMFHHQFLGMSIDPAWGGWLATTWERMWIYYYRTWKFALVKLIISISENGLFHLSMNLGMSIDPGEAGQPLHKWKYKHISSVHWTFSLLHVGCLLLHLTMEHSIHVRTWAYPFSSGEAEWLQYEGGKTNIHYHM